MSTRSILTALLCLFAVGCATPPMAEQQPTLANIQLARGAEMPMFSLGDFGLAPGKPAGMDRSITIRASTLSAPGGSFAQYLRQTLETELRGAGKLDAAAPTTISGQLTRSEIATNPPTARGTLAARFIATRNGQVIYDRELTVSEDWGSSFIGAVAIPLAMDRYTALYPELVTALLSDPEFRTAVRQE